MSAGVFTVRNTSSSTEQISSVTILFSDPTVFDLATLTAAVGGSTSTASLRPGGTTPFALSPSLAVAPGEICTLTLTVRIASGTAALEAPRVIHAAAIPIRGMPSALLILLLAMLTPVVSGGRGMRVLAIIVLLAAAQAGCGGDGSGGQPSSAQTVSRVEASNAGGPVSFQGLPMLLGRIFVR